MGFFNWAAPLFGRFADRWDDAGISQIRDWLRPYVEPGGTVLDVGGGTGALANRLSVALSARVTVLDPTPEMLAYLPDTERIVGIQGTAEAMPFNDGTFDAAITTDAFHHFRDQDAAVRELARVVRPGGGLVVVELDPRGVVMRTVAWGERLLGEPGAFLTEDEMCRFMSERGIQGDCARLKGPNYRFVGTVRPGSAGPNEMD